MLICMYVCVCGAVSILSDTLSLPDDAIRHMVRQRRQLDTEHDGTISQETTEDKEEDDDSNDDGDDEMVSERLTDNAWFERMLGRAVYEISVPSAWSPALSTAQKAALVLLFCNTQHSRVLYIALYVCTP